MQAKAGRSFLKTHMLRCFPNNPAAPRLSDPAANNPQLITPYFGHFALPELIEHGDMDFVLGQYRTCWGWSLGDGRTTWLEVFDTRWSHCHQWAGCPTWQLSRYLLGVTPRFDLGELNFAVSLATGSLTTGSLTNVSGTLPIAGRNEVIKVSWTKDATTLRYTLETLHSADAASRRPPLRRQNAHRAGGPQFTATWPIDVTSECRAGSPNPAKSWQTFPADFTDQRG